MKPPCLHPALRASEAVAATLGVLLNMTLAILIIFRTEKELRPYARVLLCNCCVDGIFSLLAYVFEFVRFLGIIERLKVHCFAAPRHKGRHARAC